MLMSDPITQGMKTTGSGKDPPDLGLKTRHFPDQALQIRQTLDQVILHPD